MTTNDKIICPKCGCEYLPAEIYYPNCFLGKPKNIIKNNNKIIAFSNGSMDLEEEYICDNCLTKFSVIAEVKFNTEIIVESDFTEDYISRVK